MSNICIIVGHGKSKDGGYDSGAVNGSYHEFKIAREIAKYAAEHLNANFNVNADLMNYDGSLYLTDRIKAVNKADYDFIAEIHLNAGGGKGTEVYYYHDSPTGLKAAQAIAKNISKAFSVPNRGAKVWLNDNGKDYFAIIRETNPCAILVETLFIDNNDELAMLKTTEGQKRCGIMIAEGIAAAKGLKVAAKSETTVAPQPSAKKSYNVQIGPYSAKSEAESIREGLEKLGFNSKIVED